ncbi:MAG TPA: excinuclease ABC subunit UvrC [Acidimicrobiales bacterium]|nr:excinuclease ABC subunit UvrC [Acidimicrobiales bacterium]
MRNRPPASSIPDAPGSYQFVDAEGRVLYVGKAKSLRSRLSNYFADPSTLLPRTAQLVAAADHVEWITVASEVDAIFLEYNLIKEHRPRFNIRLVDDKSYPWLAVTVADEWPRAVVVRGRRRAGVRYFGPYAHAGAIRDTLDLLVRSFPVRTCSDGKLDRHRKMGAPCLLFHIDRCSGPCVGEVGPEQYEAHVENLMGVLAGHTAEVEARLERDMAEAADALDFERAARLRDQLATLRLAVERQQMVTERPEDLDVIGVDEDPLEAAVCVLHVRQGRIVGRRAFVVDKVEDLSRPQLLGRVLEELYADAAPAPASAGGRPVRPSRGRGDGWASGGGDPSVWGSDGAAVLTLPRAVLVPEPPEDAALYEGFLAERRGGPVALKVPLRGGKRALMETAAANAADERVRRRLRRASDHDSRGRALGALQEALGLPQAPLRIECYDMSHLQGTAYVGSMVVLEDGLPRKSEYRRFRIRDVPGNDDYAAMEEVLTRRLSALLEARAAKEDTPAGSRVRRFAYAPHLLLLDGGKGQLGVGVRVLERLGLAEEIPVAALAKAFEEVYLPGSPDPVRIPRGSEALFLLQQIRDEAHRFAVSYHRQLRGKRMTASGLEGVPGLGEVRRRRLLRELGTMKAVRAASVDDLVALGWLPEPVARALHTHLHAPVGPRTGGRRPGPARSRAPVPAPGRGASEDGAP